MLTFAVVDGAGWMAGFDCSVTSFALLMMMSPVSHSTGGWSSTKVTAVETVEITSVSPTPRSPTAGHQPSSTRRNPYTGSPVNSLNSSESRLEKEIDAVLSEDIFQQV